MNERCEPQPEWRDRDGWYWLKKGGSKLLAYWTPRDEWWDAVHFSGNARTMAAMGFSVIAPVTPPATVAALVEALEWMITNDDTNEGDTPMLELGGQTWDEFNAYWIEGLNRARAALALYREAGR